MMTKRILSAALALALSVPCASWALEINFQSVYPSVQTQNVKTFAPWAASFAEATKGQLVVHFFANGGLVEHSNADNALRTGGLDITILGPGTFPKLYPHAYLSNLPFLSKNARHAMAVSYALYEQVPEVKKELDAAGEVLCLWNGASYAIASTKAPISSPADLKGRRVLIVNPADSTMIEAWGGVPVYVASSDAYVGLQRGMGEAFYCAVPFHRGLRIMEVAKYVTQLPSTSPMLFLAVNRTVWDEDLDDAQRALFKSSTGRPMAELLAASLDQDVESVLGLYEKAGAKVIHLSDEQLGVFHKALQPLIEGYWVKSAAENGLGSESKAWIDRFYQIAASVPAPE